MRNQVITDPQWITADWLTEVLRRGGTLGDGRVTGVEVEAQRSDWAANARLRLRYSAGATGRAPTRLFLKMCDTSQGGFIVDSEVNYYARDYVGLADAPLVPCYDAVYSAEQQAYHILLDDLSDTHRNTWEMTPTLDYGLSLARALAALHAHRWGPTRWAGVDAALPTEAQLGRYVEIARAGLEPMLDEVRGSVPAGWEAAVRAVFDHHPRLMVERTRDAVGFTVVHGDVNKGNILWPIHGQGKTYLIDRQPFDWSLTTWLGAHDLAYMMVTYWDTEVRRRLEMAVLREYHTGLVSRGVTDYTWEGLLQDYRLAVAQTVYVASEWCRNAADIQRMRWVWYPELQRGMAALEDWRCAALWS